MPIAISRVRFHVELQRYTQPYPSSDVAVWKTGQGRDEYLLLEICSKIMFLGSKSIQVLYPLSGTEKRF